RGNDVLNVCSLEWNSPEQLTAGRRKAGDRLLGLSDDLTEPAALEYYRRCIAGAVFGPAPFHVSCLRVECGESSRVMTTNMHNHETVVHDRGSCGAIKRRGC